MRTDIRRFFNFTLLRVDLRLISLLRTVCSLLILWQNNNQ